jgi:manganese/zinc/iron transport system permease protein
LLIAPAATAYLITDNLKWMLVIACIAGIVASIAGYYFAVWLDGSIAGAIAAASGILFVLAVLLSPTHGILFKKLRTTSLG